MTSGKPFWKTVPRTSLITFLLGVFFIFSIVGFASDIAVMGRQTPLRLVLNVVISGLFPVFYAVSGFVLRKHFWKAMVPLFALHLALINGLGFLLPDHPLVDASVLSLQSRLSFDAVAVTLAVAIGYVSFLYASITEARRYFRVHAEMELAAEIHRVLVPSIDAVLGDFQFYGYSSPSGEVGGDLIDLVGSKSRWVAYVADVSGHGVAPGVVAGMVKSASRMLLSSPEDSLHLQSRLNQVLYPLKNPDMFVTFCFVDCNAGRLNFGLSVHPAILRFSAKTKEVTQLECSNFPLGILPEADFATAEVHADEGDVFALYTDGLLEATNAAGEEFGIKRFEIELRKHGSAPLSVICQSLQESVASHGAQLDDQSVLLIRRSAQSN
jgi:sigma-B regulation protein RsbU (phosphoserine phosphatase)